jgi:hypothetical protein
MPDRYGPVPTIYARKPWTFDTRLPCCTASRAWTRSPRWVGLCACRLLVEDVAELADATG